MPRARTAKHPQCCAQRRARGQYRSVLESAADAAQEMRSTSKDAARADGLTRVLSAQNTVLLLVAFRIANALVIRTFFQPDEYYQSLEPAWQLAFGPDSGAWITWEWHNQLRSSLHPLLFAVVYRVAAALADVCSLGLEARSQVLLAAPKLAQAAIAAAIDWFSWKCAQRVFVDDARSSWLTLALSVASPWQFFCSARTFSNSLETALTIVALSFWPWQSAKSSSAAAKSKDDSSLSRQRIQEPLVLSQYRTSLCLAFLAIVLRPTNVLIWIPLALHLLTNCPTKDRLSLVREPMVCGIGVLCLSTASDRWYYGTWTFPPYRFLQFNIAQNLAVFYGSSRGDYYLTEGLPLLLTTSLPFTLIGLYRHLTSSYARQRSACEALSWSLITTTTCLTAVRHKEVRFLYPLLPICNLLAARPLAKFLQHRRTWKSTLVACLVCINLIIAYYTTQIHQQGVIAVIDYLRTNHENLRTLSSTATMSTVAFLMPCHSTPWRSQLVHKSISAWALTCEPPINVPLASRSDYRDEADQFYDDPHGWLDLNMASSDADAARRSWPQKLVMFDNLIAVIEPRLQQAGYTECWRGFNSHWHDDWRRKGDVVVLCK